METRGGGGWGRPGTRSGNEWLPPQPPGEAGKGCTGVLPLRADLLASPGTEVDTGACESSPADGALFGSLSPQTRGRPERGLFPEGLDFPTGTKWGLLAGHESWRGAPRAGLSAARRRPSDIRQIPPSPQLGLTAGSPREAPNKGRKMGHVYSFTDQPGPGWPTGPRFHGNGRPSELPVGSSVTTAPSIPAHPSTQRHSIPWLPRDGLTPWCPGEHGPSQTRIKGLYAVRREPVLSSEG